MLLNAPQIIWFVIILLHLGFGLAKHGQKRNDEHNFFVDLFATAFSFGLLYWGGFFG